MPHQVTRDTREALSKALNGEPRGRRKIITAMQIHKIHNMLMVLTGVVDIVESRRCFS